MTAPDPFAQATAQAAGTTSTAPAPAGSNGQQSTAVPANPVADTANPFKKASEVGSSGQDYDPFVPLAYLERRMLVMVPRSFRTDAEKKPEFGGGVTDEWRVDIIVLDGGTLTFPTKVKDPDNPNGDYIEKEVTYSEFPATFRGQGIRGGQLVGALNGANKAGGFLYGVLRRVPVMQDVRSGKTIETLDQEIQAWRQKIAAGIPATDVRYTWNLDDRPQALTPEREKLALAWWEQESAARLKSAAGK